MYEIPKKEGFKSISYVCTHGGHFGNVPGSSRCRAGTTPIDQGMANSAEDFTIYNDKIAASLP